MRPITLFNTLTRSLEPFKSILPGKASMYTCGPTVYCYAHIGNLRTYIFEDVLKRTLKKAGYDVKHIMNITDVGHLQSDADEGEDKMLVASKREKKDAWQIAKFYETAFLRDYDRLNLQQPDTICRATEHIPEMIEAIKRLEERGYTYTVDNNVYFDVEKFPTYTNFAKLKLNQQDKGRVEIDLRKKHQEDFVLWFSNSKYPNQIMKWDSPWGVGFPGWHIECSAMAMKYLGERLDIHCGGVDHISVHHSNEIAQAEALLGHRWTNYWLHGEFLTVDAGKMSKSSGVFVTLDRLIEEGFEPVHYRFFCLNSSYRNTLAFSFEVLEQSRKDFETLKNRIVSWQHTLGQKQSKRFSGSKNLNLILFYQTKFWDEISNDLNTHNALLVLREVVKDDRLNYKQKMDLLIEFDDIFGIGISSFKRYELNLEQRSLLERRAEARKLKDWNMSDSIRSEFEKQGILLNDECSGSVTWYLKRFSL